MICQVEGGRLRTWTADNPKAGLMARKRDAIIGAALRAFLEEGYAGSSVNRIAADAGVSIKTLYRHYDDKDDLFVAVIQAACSTAGDATDPPWFDEPPLTGLAEAGRDHLHYALSDDQLALYRVVIRESQRFPELGQRYRQEVLGHATRLFTGYVARWPAALRAKIGDPVRAAHRFGALLRADILQTALLGGPVPGAAEISRHAQEAATDLLALAEAERL
jgi:AcrR family transcriptional regulator